ncbi:MAG: translation initiation factor IF-2 [Candidatus Poribacteria bacterium]|nr:translation initiation factor IF-2 [Candidatus Poribacteria bacterium]
MTDQQIPQANQGGHANVRVYAIAKQYDLSSKDFIQRLADYGVSVKSHMSTLDAKTLELIETKFSENADVADTNTANEKAEKEEAAELDSNETKNKKKVKSKKNKKEKKNKRKKDVGPSTLNTEIEIEEGVSVGRLANTLNKRPTEIIMQLMKLGVMANVNQNLDFETLTSISSSFNFVPVRQLTLEEINLVDESDDPTDLMPRAPVITIMGHVDHGKTSLLDAVRQSNVLQTEAGSITQHIGAYHVELDGGKVVFLDTPGHAAFTAMRSRGAEVTDLVVLIVAADDGIMPQTIEAISHAKAANVPIVVAINKIDVATARPDFVKQQLIEQDLMPEEWGGQTTVVEISALERLGIDDLLELILLEAELLELKANPDKLARATVVEAKLDRGRGAAATILVQEGTLRVGDAFVAGMYSGRVRAMIDDWGKPIEEAGPSTPVEVLGFNGVPEAGDAFYAVRSEKVAKEISDKRQAEHRENKLGANSRVTLEALFEQVKSGNVKDLNVILKGDVQGSVQAIAQSLIEQGNKEVGVNVIHQAVGGITEADILLATASNAIVVGFNVHPTTEALRTSDSEGIDVRSYNVIYELINDVRSAIEGMLEPEVREVVLGRAVIREIFQVPRAGIVAGSYVNWGKVVHNQPLRVLRNNRLIYEGKTDSLRRFQDNVNEVATNYECGISIDGFDDFKIDDVLECYTEEYIARKL